MEMTKSMSAEVEVAQAKNIRAALVRAQAMVGTVGKGDRAEVKNKDGKFLYAYDYTSGEDMLAHCLVALHACELSWEMIGWDIEAACPGWNVPTLVGHFELSHGPSGETLQRKYKMPIASRNDADKALSGAITYLLGTATRCLLMVPKISEAESNNAPDRRTSEHGGWHDRDEPRSQRVVTPAPQQRVTPQDERGHRQAPQAGSISGDMTEKQLDAAITKAFNEIRGIIPEMTAAILREEAGVPTSGKTTVDQRKKLLQSMERRLKEMRAAMEGDPPPSDEDIPY